MAYFTEKFKMCGTFISHSFPMYLLGAYYVLGLCWPLNGGEIEDKTDKIPTSHNTAGNMMRKAENNQ